MLLLRQRCLVFVGCHWLLSSSIVVQWKGGGSLCSVVRYPSGYEGQKKAAARRRRRGREALAAARCSTPPLQQQQHKHSSAVFCFLFADPSVSAVPREESRRPSKGFIGTAAAAAVWVAKQQQQKQILVDSSAQLSAGQPADWQDTSTCTLIDSDQLWSTNHLAWSHCHPSESSKCEISCWLEVPREDIFKRSCCVQFLQMCKLNRQTKHGQQKGKIECRWRNILLAKNMLTTLICHHDWTHIWKHWFI